MPTMVERPKWILYKHTNDRNIIEAVAVDIKNRCLANVGKNNLIKMQSRMHELNLYTERHPNPPNDSMNHRVNTLEYYMFGYRDNGRFLFSPLGNLYLDNINDPEKCKKIFASMLFGVQFPQPTNHTPDIFQLYPFRLLLKLMRDPKLGCKLYSAEYVYLVAFVEKMTDKAYDQLVNNILEFRNKLDVEKKQLLLHDEHTYVNCTYEWQYYTQKLFASIGLLDVVGGSELVKLAHPKKPESKSPPTYRTLKTGYATIKGDVCDFIDKLLENHPIDEEVIKLDDPEAMRYDLIKKIFSFYPDEIVEELDLEDDTISELLKFPEAIEKYSRNPEEGDCYEFEKALETGFNLFVDVEAKWMGGAGNPDVECKYLINNTKFDLEAKSTSKKLTQMNPKRAKLHRSIIGGIYTIVITPQYSPGVLKDIDGEDIVILLVNTLCEYLVNNMQHGVRDIPYSDFESIIRGHLGKDVSKAISEMTMQKFAAPSN